jgi:hypothetical protein
MNLKVQVATDPDRIAGLPHRADPFAGVDAVAALDQGRPRHVGVEVAARLSFAVNQQVVAVEDGVVAGPQHGAAADRDQGRAAGGDDVEAFVPAPAAARRAELADVAAGAVAALDREDVVVIGEAAVGGGEPGGGRSGAQRQK